MFRKDRHTDNRGGGVLLYVKDIFHPTEYHTKTQYGEHVWCRIGSLLIGVCYRSSNTAVVGADNATLLNQLLLEVSNSHVLILGDFNYPEINWSSHTTSSTACGDTDDFLKTVEDCFYTEHVQTPTRDDSILDLVLTRDPDLVSNVQVLYNFGSSDHSMIVCTVHSEHKLFENSRMICDYCKGDYASIRNVLSETNWDHLLKGLVKQLLLDLESEFIPLKEVRNSSCSKKPIWMAHKALRCVRRKGKVFRKYRDEKHPVVKLPDKKKPNINLRRN